MSKFSQVRRNGHTITCRDYAESSKYKVRARSERHAHRIANDLGWRSKYNGPGRTFWELYYYNGYVTLYVGLDI